LIILVFATSSVASATVTTLEFNTQQLCQMAVRELANLTEPVVTEVAVRYKVLGGACAQTSEVVQHPQGRTALALVVQVTNLEVNEEAQTRRGTTVSTLYN
jgi:hypothetical protein